MRQILTFIIAIFGIVSSECANVMSTGVAPDTSQWIMFRGEVEVDGDIRNNELTIAADSKYWLWVNGKLEVREGGLKRGPNRTGTYADVVQLKHLRRGRNVVAVLVWYWGRQGFSHRSSDCPGLYFSLRVGNRICEGDGSWRAALHPAYYLPGGEIPNFRLSESNIGFDAGKDVKFYEEKYNDSAWDRVRLVSLAEADWNELVARPIPQWKDYGLKEYKSVTHSGDKWVCELPYNAQVTPYLKIKARGGEVIDIRTDQYYGGGPANVRAEYVARAGTQEYENLGWMNGHKVIYEIPDGVDVVSLKYRETGYDCELSGSFDCSDPILTTLWQKSQRTLYVTMRDNYMDCPDRERAQWIGDVTNELVETFYSLSPEATGLTRKCIREFADWQRTDSVMYSPVPDGNWNKELPMQTMAMVGLGTWNYFLGSGDSATIRYVNDAYRRYVHKWEIEPSGLVKYRKGAWDWGDWGTEQDMQAMCQMWYSIMLEYYARQCELVGNLREAEWARATNHELKIAIRASMWNGRVWRSPNYTGQTDDRTQALAFLAGLVRPEENEQVLNTLITTRFASPYMERYVLEAMCEMGYVNEAVERMKERYRPMADNTSYSTLWEIFDLHDMSGNGGVWSVNHAWSGAPLIVLSKYVAGIKPSEPGFKAVEISPMLCGLEKVKTVVPTGYGLLKVAIEKSCCRIEMEVNSPVPVKVRAPKGYYVEGGKQELKAGKHKVVFSKKK